MNTGGAYLLRDGTAPLAGNQNAACARSSRSTICRFARPVRLIKMDVEGAEPLVMRGAARLLAEDRPVDPVRAAPDAARTRVGHERGRVPGRMRTAGLRRPSLERGSIGAPLERAPAVAVSLVFVPVELP